MQRFFIRVPEDEKANHWYLLNGYTLEADENKIIVDLKEPGQEFYEVKPSPFNDRLKKIDGFRWTWDSNKFYQKGILRINLRYIHPVKLNNRDAAILLRREKI